PLYRLHLDRRSGARCPRRLQAGRPKRMRTVNTLVGQPIERLEDLRLVRGRGQYVDDLERKDMLHAAILRSSVAHGRLRSIDVTRAQKFPGVHSVITAA